MKVLILGASGMLGSTVFKVLSRSSSHDVWGTLRSNGPKAFFPTELRPRLVAGIDVLDHDTLVRTFARVRPNLVVNCVGLIKQLADANDPLTALPINAMLPHRLATLCDVSGSRLVHVSTDCVFSGRQGNYLESDTSDAEDLYGKSKYIGEVTDRPHVVTLRTSIIGHELNSKHALIEWFLAQEGTTKGFTRAIFSGLPTTELAKVIRDVVSANESLHGLYHVSSMPIAKRDLLELVARVYRKQVEIVPDDSVEIDRSLNSTKFTLATGYSAPEWPAMIETMLQSASEKNAETF